LTAEPNLTKSARYRAVTATYRRVQKFRVLNLALWHNTTEKGLKDTHHHNHHHILFCLNTVIAKNKHNQVARKSHDQQIWLPMVTTHIRY